MIISYSSTTYKNSVKTDQNQPFHGQVTLKSQVGIQKVLLLPWIHFSLDLQIPCKENFGVNCANFLYQILLLIHFMNDIHLVQTSQDTKFALVEDLL